mmetsp:Transcript_82894/g.156063  ORF Transcript_82894/g.156063 Transcript_82894/m.156063 type:complete len:246 (-) Transcript_82894:219-956(-)
MPPPDHCKMRRAPCPGSKVCQVSDSVEPPNPRGLGTPAAASLQAASRRSVSPATEAQGDGACTGTQARTATCAETDSTIRFPTCSASTESCCTALAREAGGGEPVTGPASPETAAPTLEAFAAAVVPAFSADIIRPVTSTSPNEWRCCMRAMKASMSSLLGALAPGSAPEGCSDNFWDMRRSTWKSVRTNRRAWEHSKSNCSVSCKKFRVCAVSWSNGPVPSPMEPYLCVQLAHACSSCKIVRMC